MQVLNDVYVKSWMILVGVVSLAVAPGSAFSQSSSSPTKTNNVGTATPESTVSRSSYQQAVGVSQRLALKEQPAAQAAAKNFTGKWRSKETANEKNQRMRSIENATAILSMFIRGKAREKMNKMTVPATELKIEDIGSQIKFSHAGQEFVVGTNGQSVTIKTPKGAATVRAGKRNGKLIVLLKTAEVSKTTVYELSADEQSLKQHTEITSNKLATPVRFTTNFQRQ